jgi:hypothetical protein
VHISSDIRKNQHENKDAHPLPGAYFSADAGTVGGASDNQSRGFSRMSLNVLAGL